MVLSMDKGDSMLEMWLDVDVDLVDIRSWCPSLYSVDVIGVGWDEMGIIISNIWACMLDLAKSM